MESLFWIGFVGAAMAGIYALIQAKKVMTFSEGTERMKQIAGAIREGANAYLQRQYKTVLPVFAAATAVVLASKYGRTVNFFSDRRVPDSRGRIVCGHTPEDGERVVIVDDLINSGKTVSNAIERIRTIADIRVAGLAAIADRFEEGMEKSGARELEETYGARVLTIVKGEDITRAIEKGIV